MRQALPITSELAALLFAAQGSIARDADLAHGPITKRSNVCSPTLHISIGRATCSQPCSVKQSCWSAGEPRIVRETANRSTPSILVSRRLWTAAPLFGASATSVGARGNRELCDQ